MSHSTKKLTTEEFVTKARAVHGDKYDYSRVRYINNKAKVEIICSLHGGFWQTPGDHLNKMAGCYECGRIRTIEAQTYDTQDFVKQAKATHGNKYGYDKVEYTRSNQKVEIICKKHGSFWQRPNDHVKGMGCNACRGEYKSQIQTLSLQEFLARCNEVHGEKYDYSKIVYIGSEDRVEIFCPIHGSFWQHARSHYLGRGCAKCAGVGRLTTDEFTQRAVGVHGDKYNYSKVSYKSHKSKVEITCYQHGSFFQNPNDHLGGAGCPDCGRLSKGEESIGKLLENWGIRFKRERRFKQCKDKSYLPFDFYFQIGSLRFLIEYDGIQHFATLGKWNSKEKLAEIQKRDAIKTKFAQDNGFILIRIPYTEYDNIETILKGLLFRESNV